MTIQTSWEVMQQYREALSVAKWRKQVRAEHLEKIRLASEHMRSMQYWFKMARIEETLKARKAALADGLSQAHMLTSRDAAIYCCQVQLVGDSCQSNLRNAMSWTETALTAPTFKDWDCCLLNAESSIDDALVQLDVALSKFKALWKQAKADMITARSVIDTCAKDILHPVALSKKEKKEIAKRNITQTVGNRYNLVSAAACITQREEGTILGTKLWLRLVRATRYNHINRNAHNFNNKQDYLVRLPVYTKLPIWCGAISLR